LPPNSQRRRTWTTPEMLAVAGRLRGAVRAGKLEEQLSVEQSSAAIGRTRCVVLGAESIRLRIHRCPSCGAAGVSCATPVQKTERLLWIVRTA
ncbi:MAG TPA: hypothetical protein VH083_01300, partial [Myxococcales bacterium]|nr:hypothetical protein [Myxococcales bacterium]